MTTNQIDECIARNIRINRKACGISQEAIGELLGVSFQQVQKYEMAKNRVSASSLFVISKSLNIPIQDFFSDIQNNSEECVSGDIILGIQKIKKLGIMSSQDRWLVFKLVDRLLEKEGKFSEPE